MISSASIPASAINAGELLHFQSPSLTERTLLIAVSQSGESYEVIELLKKQRRLPITVIGITNESGSSLAVMATHCLLCKAYLSRSLTFLKGHSFVQVIGRGTVFAAVAQTALMFMEATKIPASALLGGEFRHGPLEMVGPDFICIVYAHSQSGAYHPSIRLVEDVLSFKGKVILISDAASGI